MASAETETRTVEITKETEDQARELLKLVRQEMGSFEDFVARRFDELSVEINATAQQMGLVEEEIIQRFGDMIGVLGSISKEGDGRSAHNTGVELDTVIKTTEDAANTIMDAADKIANNLQKDIDWTDEAARQKLLDEINGNLQEILLACTFQDLTGQRITKALENLRAVESQLGGTLEALGIDIGESETKDSGKDQQSSTTPDEDSPPASQDEIDALFG